MTSVYVIHNGRDDVEVDHDIWLVIDTVSGTAISMHSTRQKAEEDKAIVEAFYERWPNGEPTDSAFIEEGVDEQGEFVGRFLPLLARGFWGEHDFD